MCAPDVMLPAVTKKKERKKERRRDAARVAREA